MGKRKPEQKWGLIGGCGALAVLLAVLLAFCTPSKTVPDPTVPETTAAPTEATTQPVPSVSRDDWNLILVNPWHAIPDGYTVELEQIDSVHAVDVRVWPALQAMLTAAEAEGLEPILCSSYRTMEKQEALFSNKLERCMAEGYSREEAVIEAGKWVAIPGTSEHQTGLAVDIVSASYQVLDRAQEDTPEQQWLMENSYLFGFIMRYPEDKSDLTGIYYEPWHYRYVGKEAAKEIYERGICLEEYLEEIPLG